MIEERLNWDDPKTKAEELDLRLFRELLLGPQTWLLVLLTLCITISSGVITTFSATLIHSFGYDSKQSALLNMPSGIVSIFATILSTWVILKRIPRWLSIIGLLIPALVGAALLSFEGVSRPAGSLAGIYLVNFVSLLLMDVWCTKADVLKIVAPLDVIYDWVGTNYEGHARKVIAGTVVSVAFGIANIIGPQTYQKKEAPGYRSAKNTIMGVIASAIATTVALGALYAHRNGSQRSEGFKYCL